MRWSWWWWCVCGGGSSAGRLHPGALAGGSSEEENGEGAAQVSESWARRQTWQGAWPRRGARARRARRGGARIGGSWTGSDEKRRRRLIRHQRGSSAGAASSRTIDTPSVLESRIPLKKNGPSLGLKSGISTGSDGGGDTAFAINFDELAASISMLSSERRLGHVAGDLSFNGAEEEEAASGTTEGKDSVNSGDVTAKQNSAGEAKKGDTGVEEDEKGQGAETEAADDGDAWLDDLLG